MNEPDVEAFQDVRRLIVGGAHADGAETMCGGTPALLDRGRDEALGVAYAAAFRRVEVW